MTLDEFIKRKTPPMNKRVAEGLSFHEMKNALNDIDRHLKYASLDRTRTHLKYLRHRVLPPREVFNIRFKTSSTRPYDMAKNSMYLVEFIFHYADEEEPRTQIIGIPYIDKYNTFILNDKEWLLEPTFADKVVSIGDSQIFINVITAKYTLGRILYTILEDNLPRNVSVMVGELYRNQVKQGDDTTKAKSTFIHYLLGYYGYSKTMEIVLGFVPKPVYDVENPDEFTVYSSTGSKPDGFVGPESNYRKNTIKFIVPKDKNTPETLYCIGNVLYVLDNFSNSIVDINQLDDPLIWRRYMGEIIHTGNRAISETMRQMSMHFKDLDYEFNASTIQKLEDIDIKATGLIQLLTTIFINFNRWIVTGSERSIYGNKTLEVNPYALSRVTSAFTKLYLNINKEEQKSPNGILTPEEVSKVFKDHLNEWLMNGLRNESLFVSSIEDSSDHSYFKKTAFISRQESNSVNTANKGGNTSTRHKLTASMATQGSALYLSKKNPDLGQRQNPYVTLCPVTNTVLPDPDFFKIVEDTDVMLATTFTTEGNYDLGDSLDPDVDNEDYYDDEGDVDQFEDDFSN